MSRLNLVITFILNNFPFYGYLNIYIYFVFLLINLSFMLLLALYSASLSCIVKDIALGFLNKSHKVNHK